MHASSWKELLELYRKMKKEDPHAFDQMFEALEQFRCLTVLWGLEDSENVEFKDSNHKRHTLLAYKHLGVLWFTELPTTETSKFKIFVRGDIPRTATQEKVLETFNQDSETLEQLCNDLPKPTWVGKESKSRVVSLTSFPLRAKR